MAHLSYFVRHGHRHIATRLHRLLVLSLLTLHAWLLIGWHVVASLLLLRLINELVLFFHRVFVLRFVLMALGGEHVLS